MQDTGKITLYDGREINHGDCVDLPMDMIVPNTYNPNEMDDASFSLLEDNVERIGFVDPIVVVPGEDGNFLIVDGAHRFEQRKISGEKEIPCIVVSPEIFDEKTLMLQTVRLNKIRGALNPTKFNALVDQLVNKHEVPFDDLMDELGFADESEFETLIDQGRQQIPKEARKEYDKAVKRISSVENLAKLIERLWLKYGNTVPANFMILEFNNKRHLWVTLHSASMSLFTDLFRECMSRGYTIDSFMEAALLTGDLDTFIELHGDKLRRIEEEDGALQDLDDLLEP